MHLPGLEETTEWRKVEAAGEYMAEIAGQEVQGGHIKVLYHGRVGPSLGFWPSGFNHLLGEPLMFPVEVALF